MLTHPLKYPTIGIMKSIKLHTALKVKNRLAGEVRRLEHVLVRENSRRNDNPSKVNIGDIYAQLRSTRAKLVSIKAAIAAANVPIYSALALLEEAKSEMAYMGTIPDREGEEVIPTHTGQLTYQWTAYLNRATIDQYNVELQKKINNFQDVVDSFNAATSITIDFE